jgi:hypothetical protein
LEWHILKPVDSKKPNLKLVQISFWAMYNLDSHRRYSHSLATELRSEGWQMHTFTTL